MVFMQEVYGSVKVKFYTANNVTNDKVSSNALVYNKFYVGDIWFNVFYWGWCGGRFRRRSLTLLRRGQA